MGGAQRGMLGNQGGGGGGGGGEKGATETAVVCPCSVLQEGIASFNHPKSLLHLEGEDAEGEEI